MIKDIKELNFPAYATLETATATIADMGDRTITSQVKIDGDVVPDFSYDWEVEFKGEIYIHPVRTPQGTKDNTSIRSKVDLVFHHWAIHEMKRHYFVEMASTSSGTAVADKYIASLGLNLEDFVTAFNLVLNHYFGGRIIIKLNPEWQYDTEAKFISISYSYIWDVLQQMHEIYGVRWTLKTNAEGVCEILMGYPAEEVSHIFEYGFEGGLLSVQRQVQSTEIRNRLLGRGGSKNLPHRYFKDKDPNNPLFEADPDWIPELANSAFTELRGKTFRDYVRGWKAKRYGGTPMDEPTEAYLAGYNAEKFDPIEYVDDKESIEKYGVLVGALENNEEIYPSIQGAPGDVDMIVDAEQVTDDDVDAAVENDSVTTNLESGHQTYRNAPANSTITIETLTKRYFSVPAGKVGNLDMSLTVTGKYSNFGDYEETYPILNADTVKIAIYDRNTDAIITSSTVPVINIPAGDYYYMISAEVETNYDKTSMVTLNIESVHLYTSTPGESEGWRQTFDVWIRNIWNSSRNVGETDQQYADRVWLPILGDRMGDEARVVFASGWLSFSSDWEFPIVGYAFDDSKAGSHWRLTLEKIDAEKDAGKPFIPYEGYNASAGDRFFFIGIDMPWQYVYWGEERIDDYKRDSLLQTAKINPAWVIKADKVRLNQNREDAKLIDSLSAGAQIRLASKQFISGVYESLYVQSMTYSWTADTILYPNVEVVVSDKVFAVKNPVAQMQGNIETLQRQVGSLSNIQQIIRQVCDQLYLRKDGVEDLSKSPTRFLGKVTGEKFRQGQIGGRDWGIYRDENGNAILEADKLVARQGILVSDLVVNEATYVGGLQINSAAAMKVTAVEETEGGYICYFDQQQGSVTNKFKVDDVALCQKFDPEDNEVKFYKRRVVAVAETSVTLSKTDVNGDGIPAIDDEIIHYGNYTDKTRQFVIIRDVIGGGYERMLMGLDSVTSEGFEYYFAGKSADSKARWFVGDSEQYAKYENGQLTIKGNLLVTGSDKPITDQLDQLEFIRKAFGDGAQGLILGTAIIVGYNDADGKFVPMAGMSGVFNKDAENGGPAAWYGGTMDEAMSMIFMDGTGYFANGLFSWDKEKGINLGNGQLKINYDGSVDFGGNIRIGSTGEETLDSLLTIVAGLTEMWYLDEDGNVCTDRNVIIAGDTSSGGEGEDTPASGIRGIYMNNVPYTDEDGDGFIDLGTISGGVSEITASMITSALGYTPANGEDYLPLAGGTLNGTLTINAGPAIKIYRPTGTPYIRFGRSEAQEFGELGVDVNNGNPVWWGLVEGGSAYGSWHNLIHTGNIGSYALPLSGGVVNGTFILKNNSPIYSKYANNSTKAILGIDGSNNVILGWEAASGGSSTYIDGANVYLRYGTSRTNGLILNSSGNVTIGSSDLAGTSTKLYVNGYQYINFANSSDSISGATGLHINRYGFDSMADAGAALILTTGSKGNVIYGGNMGFAVNYYNGSAHTRLITGLPSGNVGIGTTSPSYKLDVNGTAYASYLKTAGISIECDADGVGGSNWGEINRFASSLYLQNRAGDLYLSHSAGTTYIRGLASITGAVTMSSTLTVGDAINTSTISSTYVTINTTSTGGWDRAIRFQQNGSNKFRLGAYGTGSVMDYGYIGTTYTAPWVKFTPTQMTVNGDAIITGDTSSGSDIRFKDIIKNKTLKIEDIAKAPLFTFKWNDRDDDAIHLGSSAQYWEKVCPWLVTGEDFKSLNYAVGAMGGVISLARHDLQQDKKIKAQGKEIKALKRTVKVLEKEIKRLKEEMRYGG